MAVMRSYAYLMRAYDGPEIAGIPAHMCGPAGQYDNAPTASSPRFTHRAAYRDVVTGDACPARS